jgi:hypothetical protein
MIGMKNRWIVRSFRIGVRKDKETGKMLTKGSYCLTVPSEIVKNCKLEDGAFFEVGIRVEDKVMITFKPIKTAPLACIRCGKRPSEGKLQLRVNGIDMGGSKSLFVSESLNLCNECRKELTEKIKGLYETFVGVNK